MSTPNNQEEYFGASEVQVRPRVAVTFVVRGIEDAKETASGDYQMAKINVEVTRGGRKFFPSILFHTNEFMKGFTPKMYTTSDDDYLNEVPDGKEKTRGQIFSIVYRNNIKPEVKTSKTGEKSTSAVSVLMMLCGGTLESLGPLAARLKVFGDKEPTPEQVIAVLRDQINEQPEVEQVAVLKQSRDQDGELSDNYEVQNYFGPLTTKTQARIISMAKKDEHNPDVSKRLQVYSLE